MLKNAKLTSRSFICSFVLVSCFLFFSQTSYSQNITLKFKDVPLKTVLKEVQKQTDYRFVYNDNLINVNSLVTINSSRLSIEKALDEILGKTNITYKIEGKQILLSPSSIIIKSKQDLQNGHIISCMVKDADGNPLPGAIIQHKRLKLNLYSDRDGKIEIGSVLPSDTIQVSILGMKNKSLVIGNRKEIEVVLTEDAIYLENVVITGYYTLPKERSAGAFKTVTSDLISEKASSSILDRLSGTIPGLVVNMNDGATDRYLIRGASSINSSREPLVVVDGTPMAMSTFQTTVSQEDVASITVLKDATAASIWGAKAANGVLVVTTKRGSFQSKLSVRYTGNVQIKGRPDFSYLNYMNAKEYVDFSSSIFNQNFDYANVLSNYGLITPIERAMHKNKIGTLSASQLETYLNTLRNSDNSEQIKNLLYRNKLSHQHNLKISGGSDKSAFLISFDYNRTNPSRIGSSNDRMILDMKNDVKLTNWLKVSTGVNITSLNVSSIGEPNVIGMIPYELLQNADGSNNSILHSFYSNETSSFIMSELAKRNENPFDYKIMEDIYKQKTESKALNTRFNTALQFKLIDGLEFESKFAYQKGYNYKSDLYEPNSFYVRNLRATQTPLTASAKSRIPAGYIYNKSDISSYDWTLRNQLSYNKNFDKHSINAIIGTEIRKSYASTFNKKFFGYNPTNRSYSKMDETTMSSGVAGGRLTSPASGSSAAVTFSDFGSGFLDNDDRFFSVYSNFAYNYSNKYSLNASIRMDQANLFGVGVRYKPIWSIGGVWNISQENFFKVNWIESLSIRVSRGIAGNTPNSTIGGPYDIASTGQTNFYLANIPSSTIVSPALKHLKWERTDIFNLGLDFDILNGRVYGSLDYYTKKSTDLIGSLTIDPTKGFTTINTNIGAMKNSGIEVMLNTNNIVSENFKWSTAFNLSYNKNMIDNIYINPTYDSYIYGQGFIAGYPAYSTFSYKWAGLNNVGEPTVYDAKGDATSQLVADTKALVYTGTKQSPITGGLSNTFKYKKISLWFQLSYQFGGVARKDLSVPQGQSLRLVYSNLSNHFGVSPWIVPVNKIMKDAWKQPGDEQKTDIAKWIKQGDPSRPMNYYQISDKSIISSSYIHLSDISLSYELTNSYLKKLGVKSSSLTAQITDLYIYPLNKERIDPRYITTLSGRFGAEYTLKLILNF
ncbi:MAG: SusC/RagA family TonB-linked outer membrane protein [Bacteroidales bacterium]|jgi:TonB-linked SusC/RagA family outer membrane protein